MIYLQVAWPSYNQGPCRQIYVFLIRSVELFEFAATRPIFTELR